MATNKPQRRCLACRTSYDKDQMLRFVIDNEVMTQDFTLKEQKRGYYICNNVQCIELAKKRKVFNKFAHGTKEEFYVGIKQK